MKQALTVICAISLLLLVNACRNSPETSPMASTAMDSTTIIAEAAVDNNHNGDGEKLYVRMVSGELKEETEPGPYMGTFLGRKISSGTGREGWDPSECIGFKSDIWRRSAYICPES